MRTVQVSVRTAKYARAMARSLIQGETPNERRLGDVPDGQPFVKAVRSSLRDGDTTDDTMIRNALSVYRDASLALEGRAS